MGSKSNIIFWIICWILQYSSGNKYKIALVNFQKQINKIFKNNLIKYSTRLLSFWNIPRHCLGIFQRVSEPCIIFWQTVLGEASNCLSWNSLWLIWNHPQHVEVALGFASGYFNMPRINLSLFPPNCSTSSSCLCCFIYKSHSPGCLDPR